MDQNMKIADKAEELTRKINLEGTNLSSKNIFSALSDNDIIDKSLNMDVKPNINNLKYVNVVKDLEIARHTLDMKRNQEKGKKNDGENESVEVANGKKRKKYHFCFSM